MVEVDTTFVSKIELHIQRMYKTLLPKIASFILKNSGTKDDVKDIFQECMMKLVVKYKENPAFEIKDIDSYMMMACMNTWKTEATKRGKNIKIDIEPFDDKLAVFANPYSILLKTQRSEIASKYLSKIGEKCKEMMYYYHFDKLSMREIAERLSFANENVAKTAHYKCKQKLVELMDGQSVNQILYEI